MAYDAEQADRVRAVLAPEGPADDADLVAWVERGLGVVRSLPARS